MTSTSSRGSTVAVGDPAPASKTPTLADVGGDLSKISTDAARPGLLHRRRSRTPSPPTSRSSSSSRRPSSARARSAARRSTSSSRSPRRTRRSRSSMSSRTCSRTSSGQLQPVLDAQGNLQATDVTNAWGLTSEPWIFAVDGTGVVRKSYELIATAAEIDAAIAAIAPADAPAPGRRDGLGRVLEPDRVSRVGPALPDADRGRGHLVLGEMARRELDAVLELAEAERQSLPVRRPEREAAHVGQARPHRRRRRPRRRDRADRRARVGRRRRAAEDQGGGARDDEPATSASANRFRVRRSTGQALAVSAPAPVPVLPGACSGTPAAHIGQVASPGS